MHATILKEIDEAVTAFMKSLDQMGKSDRVLGMCVSEFGRTVHSNGTNGTDHGTVSPVILFGNKVDPKVVGKIPSFLIKPTTLTRWTCNTISVKFMRLS